MLILEGEQVTNLKFKESIHVEILEPDHVFLMTESDDYLLTGAIYKELAPLLDGQHNSATIVQALIDKVPPAHVMFALKQLRARGYIVEAEGELPTEQEAFWHMMNVSVPTVNQKLAHTQVAILSVGKANDQPLRAALEVNGISLASSGELMIVLTDDYLHPDLDSINKQAREENKTWMPAKIVGESIWVGPVFYPKESGCWACMATRIRMNRQVEAFVYRRRENKDVPLVKVHSGLNTTINLGASLLATEITKWVVNGEIESLTGRLLTINTLNLEMQYHAVAHRPQCSVCGTPEIFNPDRKPQPIELKPSPKKFTMDGGHRTLSPDQAFEHYKDLISPITGVITHLINTMSETDGLAYSFIAGHDFGSTGSSLISLFRTLRGRSSGKGITESQAKMSAIGEAVERYSAVYRHEHEITVSATFDELGDQAIHPNDVWLFSQSQYAIREQWNPQQKSNYHYVPKLFPTDRKFAWTPYWSLTNGTFKYFPAFSTYFNHPEFYQGFGPSDSNGCAAGHTLEEAIYQGFLELVERDSIAIWWYNRLRYPRVDLDSFENPYTKKVEAFYASLNRSIWVLDITADLKIPTFVAVSARLDSDVEDIIVGMGTHLDPHIALLRSISELNQFLANVYFKNPDGTTRYVNDVEETVEWHKTAKLREHQYLKPDHRIRKRSDFEKMHTDDLSEDIATCVQLAHEAGLETLVADLSQPDVGMKVCRVLVPGLRHFWRRLAPGRLYDIPVKENQLSKATAETDLNPVSMFF